MALDWFNIFSKFRKKPLSPEDREEIRKQLKTQLQNSVIEADTQRGIARDAIARACRKARLAIQRNDNIEKNIAFNELRMQLALYRYTGAMYGNLRMMESNLAMQGLTENFANFVHRMSEIKVPANTVNFNKLTAEALRGIQPVDLEGVEEMTRSLIEGSMSATSTASIPDQYLMDLVTGKVNLDDFESPAPMSASPIYAEAQPAAAQPAAQPQPAVQPQPVVEEDMDAEARMLQEILEGLK